MHKHRICLSKRAKWDTEYTAQMRQKRGQGVKKPARPQGIKRNA